MKIQLAGIVYPILGDSEEVVGRRHFGLGGALFGWWFVVSSLVRCAEVC